MNITTSKYLECRRHRGTSESASEKIIKEYNEDLLRRYPWLRITSKYDYTGEFIDPDAYEYTWADAIPSGWRLAFGDQMIEELDQLIKKYNVKDYSIDQIKEKFGELRWYDNGFPKEGRDEYNEWEDRHTELSCKTCIRCGEPAKHLTKGWIMPVCKECLSKSIHTKKDATPITVREG